MGYIQYHLAIGLMWEHSDNDNFDQKIHAWFYCRNLGKEYSNMSLSMHKKEEVSQKILKQGRKISTFNEQYILGDCRVPISS